MIYDAYAIVAVSNAPASAAATLAAQLALGYHFVAWLQEPSAVFPGNAIFGHKVP